VRRRAAAANDDSRKTKNGALGVFRELGLQGARAGAKEGQANDTILKEALARKLG